MTKTVRQKADRPQVTHTGTLGYSPQGSITHPKPSATPTGVVRPKA